jgi:hypothetical protein
LSCWCRHPLRQLCRQRRATHWVRTALDWNCGQGGSRGHRQRRLGQASLHVFSLPTCVGQPNHRHERQVPKEDKSLGAPGPPAEFLQVVSPPALGAHQGQAARLDVVGPMVDHHVCDGADDRRN